jgi:hypothetical protein
MRKAIWRNCEPHPKRPVQLGHREGSFAGGVQCPCACLPWGRPFFSLRCASIGRGNARGLLGAVAVKDSKDMPGESRYKVPGQGLGRRCGASSSSLQSRWVEKYLRSSQLSAPDKNPLILEMLSSIDSGSIPRRTDRDDFPPHEEGRRTGLEKCPECSLSATRGQRHFRLFPRFSTRTVALGKNTTVFRGVQDKGSKRRG